MACTTVVDKQQWPNDAAEYAFCKLLQTLDEGSLVYKRLGATATVAPGKEK